MQQSTSNSHQQRCPVNARQRDDEIRAPHRIAPGRAQRWVLALLGIASVALGGLGVILPGLPTTIFLIFASWCFTRSCPWLEDRLIRNRFFRPFLIYLEPGRPMPRRARIITVAIIWIAITISCGSLIARDAPWFIPASVVAAGLLGSICVLRFRRSIADDSSE